MGIIDRTKVAQGYVEWQAKCIPTHWIFRFY